MNLVPCASHLPEKPDCKLVPTHHGGGACAFGASACLLKRYVSPGRSPWYSCPVRDSVRFPASVPRVNVRRTGCFMHHAEGRVTTPEGCPEIPRESDWSRSVDTRIRPVGWHSGPKTPGGPGATEAPLLGTAGCAQDPAGGREAVGCSIHVDWGPGHPPQGDMCHSVADAEGIRRASSPLSNHDPRSPARSLGCLISRIFHHLEHSWPPRSSQGQPAGGCIAFQQIVGLSDLQALRLPPTPPSRGRGRSKG